MCGKHSLLVSKTFLNGVELQFLVPINVLINDAIVIIVLKQTGCQSQLTHF